MNNSKTFLGVLLLLPLLAFHLHEVQPEYLTPKLVLVSTTNQLTTAAKAAGWTSLVDGQSTNGWHIYRKDYVSKGWKVENGAIVLDKGNGEEGGDLVSDQAFENYDLRLEWKISDCGNSGIIFNAQESNEFQYPWQTGPEMQVLDNTCHPDAKIEKHRAGDLYDMIACKKETVLPANQWNSVRIRVKNGKAQFWLNGKKVVKFTMFDVQWKAMIANSKFKNMTGFGQFRKGHIVLQDHGDKVWYRNILIREL